MSVRPRSLRLLLPLAALALPLFSAQEGGGGERVDDPIAPLPFSEPPATAAGAALVSDPESERGAPFLVPLEGGRAWLGCLEWEPGGGDRIALRELDAGGAVTRTLLVAAESAEIVRPVGALDAKGRLNVFWTELVAEASGGSGAPQLRAARLEEGGGASEARFGPPRTLTSGAGPNRNVEVALGPDGALWLAWESFVAPKDGGSGGIAGSIDVLLAPLQDGGLGPATRIGDGIHSDLDPVIVSAGGRLHVAWSSYAGRDYEIRLRSFDPKSGELGAPIDVSADGSSDDLHPALAATPDGDLWLAWDRLEDSTRGSSLPAFLRRDAARELHSVFVMSARVHGDRVLLPDAPEGWPAGAVAGAPRFSWMGGVPRLALAADGSPWIAYRYLVQGSGRGARFGEPVVAQRFGASGWSAPLEIESSVSFAEEPAIAPAAVGVFCAGQQDRRFRNGTTMSSDSSAPASVRAKLAERDVDVGCWFGPTGIFVARLQRSDAPQPVDASPPPAGVAFRERPDRRAELHFHPAGADLDDPILSGAQHLQVRRGEQLWNVYWGDLHRHSSISRCSRGFEPAPSQRFDFGRDVHLYDFMAMTDHAGQIDPFSWWQLDKMCWLFRDPRFCPLAGFECSTPLFGHQNVILDGRITPLVAFGGGPASAVRNEGLGLLYGRLTRDRAVTIPHTTADTGRRTPFEQCDPRFVKLVEVYQALRGNYEFEGCLRQSASADAIGSFAQDAMAQGLQVGFVASTDHGNGASFAGVLAEKLEPHALFTALRERRTFAATTKGLFVDLRVDDAVMGEEIAASATPRIHVKALARGEIAEVVVFRNGRPWRALGRKVWEDLDEGAIGATLVLEPPFQVQSSPRAWSLRLSSEGGEWRSGTEGRPLVAAAADAPGFALDGRGVHFSVPAGFKGFKSHELRVRLRAGRHARLTVGADGQRVTTLADLFDEPMEGRAGKESWTLRALERYDDVVDLAHGLGSREIVQEWVDDHLPTGPLWYYARVVQKDGEMAWSSPIFLTAGRR